jgi:hypothetical protein
MGEGEERGDICIDIIYIRAQMGEKEKEQKQQ